MDLPTLAMVLKMVLSASPDERKGGEEKLKEYQHKPGHLVGLMRIVVLEDVELSIRQIASINFKNLVSKDWEPDEDLGKVEIFPASDKAMVRDNLFEAIICAPPAIRLQLQECLKAVVKADYPEQWPALLPLIDSNLKSQDQRRIYGALVAFRVLARKYEFKEEEERQHLHTVVQNLFPHLLNIFKYLIAMPNPNLEIAELIKLICKIFSSACYLGVPPSLQVEHVFLDWMVCFFTLLDRPVPGEGQSDDPELRKAYPWWKVRKWVLSIVNRLYNRFGDPKIFKGELREFSLMFQKSQVAGKFLEAYLKLLAPLREGGYLPERIINLAMTFMSTSIARKEMYKLLKPHLQVLLYDIVFPITCFNDADEQLWAEDPHEYVRKGYDIFEDMYSARTAAVNFAVELVTKRSKDNLDSYVAALVTVFRRFDEAPADQKPYRQKDGAMLAVGALSDHLKKVEPYKDQLEAMLAQYIFPEFQCPMGHLRAKAAWVAGSYADIEFKDMRNFNGAMAAIVAALHDPDLPVRVDSVVALRSFVETVTDLDELRVILPQLLNEFFKLMNEVENEDLVFTLETIIEKFGEEMAPYALGLVTNLANTFWKCMDTEDFDEEEDEPGALAAMGCLRAIGTILESISSLPHLFPQLEPTLLPIMHKMLTPEGQEVLEEVLEMVQYYTYFSPTISQQMWTVWPLLMAALDEWALDDFENILGPLDNFIARGTEHFLTCKQPNYPENLFHIVAKLLNNEKYDDPDLEPAPKLLESVLQNCRGRVDEWVTPYIQLAVTRLRRTKKFYLKDLLVGVVANALYYNPSLALKALQEMNAVGEIFHIWLQMLYAAHKNGKAIHFKREHDKKVCVLGLTSMLQVPGELLPGEVQVGLTQVVKAILKLLVEYKKQQELAAKREEEEEDEEFSDDEDWAEDEDEEEGEEGESTFSQLSKNASKWLSEEDDDSDTDFTDEEEFQCPIDNVDPFIFFADTMQAISGRDVNQFQVLTGSLDFQHQAMAHSVAQHAEDRRKQIEASKLEESAKENADALSRGLQH